MTEPPRKIYVDRLRSLAILLLFPVHALMIWNDFGTRFYVWLGGDRLASTVITVINPWFMPLLFVLAGISARHSLEKRTPRQFIRGRTVKLLIPFLFGTVFLVPFQTLCARRFFDGYEGGILENIGYFFSHLTDFSGYDGAYTPGHLWFILFLYLISLLSLPVFRLLPYEKIAKKAESLPLPAMFLFVLPIGIFYYLGNFGVFSIGKSFVLYLLGFYVFSNEAVIDRLVRNLKLLTFLCAGGALLQFCLYFFFAFYGDWWVHLFGWTAILFLLAFGKKFLNRRTRLTDPFSRASYPIYLLHQSILVGIAFTLSRYTESFLLLALVTCFGSFLLTLAAYCILRKIPLIRIGIGVTGSRSKKIT